MPTEMRRPPAPDLTQWVEEMDRRLRAQVPPRRRRGSPIWAHRSLRSVRSTSRRAVSAAGMVAAAVVVMSVVSLPSVTPLPPPATGSPGPAVEEQPDGRLPLPSDPAPAYLGLFPREDRAAVAASADIATAAAELTPVPQSTARAVPTPEGGGSATAALRPTVR